MKKPRRFKGGGRVKDQRKKRGEENEGQVISIDIYNTGKHRVVK